MKIELTKQLKADLQADSIKAKDLVSFLVDNGWKTNLPIEKTSLGDMYTQTELIKGVKLDNDFLYIEILPRSKIEIESEISNDVISVSSSSTNFINLRNIKPVDFAEIKADIKALRAQCKELGIKFSCIKASDLDELFSEYMKDFVAYTEKYYATKAFWQRIVRNGLYGGYTRETDNSPDSGIEKLTYRSAPISKVQCIAHRIEELKREDLSMFNMVAI